MKKEKDIKLFLNIVFCTNLRFFHYFSFYQLKNTNFCTSELFTACSYSYYCAIVYVLLLIVKLNINCVISKDF